MQSEMILSQNIKIHERETKFMLSNSKQDPSTNPNEHFLSRATTEVLPIVTANEEKNEMSLLIKVKDFEDYVRQAIQFGLLDKQYETFPKGQTRPSNYDDKTRVILKKLPDDAHSDYINANYITGYKKEKQYIATQGPKPNTVIDFWRMIWQENVLIICMLTNVVENGKIKCEQYWPDIGKTMKYGDIIVLNEKHNVLADYCFRTFHVTCGEETRKIEHLHYMAWPDHSVPLYTYSVVTYLKKLLATPRGNGPVVVHSSAGVGRTGIIILCDICLHRAAAEGLVDVFAAMASIRSERVNMVDNKQQYLLAHLVLVECLLSIQTTLPRNEMLLTRIKELKKQLPIQQQRLQNVWQDEVLRQVTSSPLLSERSRAENRIPELILDKTSRIYLKKYPASDEGSDYLSAVYVDGVKLQNQYLATQLPMPSTINNFWQMIADFKVKLILILQPPDFQDPTCCAIAPASGEFKPTSHLNIKVKEIVKLKYYTSQKLLLVDNSKKPSREQFVTILCLTEWKSGRDRSPPPVITMVTFWQAAEKIAKGD
ncbi:PREDICTED: receptor-type tyrosine-protein phosphatase alpha-like isoform X2 [Wasmannia auropunctata]|uniref:receptor-type tyrosine-protein phosphatase alpha-like isoform X2 n=1 Tax=Wasmannia auropunctata TaxID=64793 RepID=UPI0005EF43BA|nr:PREDICTED: receptor-type tyrosine-protein phosphatase alpha-like isoform X2 [Wasmannia auropunctata]